MRKGLTIVIKVVEIVIPQYIRHKNQSNYGCNGSIINGSTITSVTLIIKKLNNFDKLTFLSNGLTNHELHFSVKKIVLGQLQPFKKSKTC